MPPVTINNQHNATKTGPAAPVTQSAARSTRLKHWMTRDEERRIEDMVRRDREEKWWVEWRKGEWDGYYVDAIDERE